MARKKRKSGSRRRGGAAQKNRFKKAAKHCWAELRAGKLPKRGQFSKCMKKHL